MKSRKLKVAAKILTVCLVLGIAGFLWYVNDYYHSEPFVEAYLQGNETIQVSEIKEGIYLDGPGKEAAVIFYPGAKVEYTAYLPLFWEVAARGTDCFLVKMPCNLAIFGVNKAGKLTERYEYEKWYLAGHSLGGAMAASYCSEHLEDVNGLILLAAYSTKSLVADEFRVLSIYGSEDQVLNRKKLETGRIYMPGDYQEVCIPGGNHAQFGAYGVQKGDGTATISFEEQIKQTADRIEAFIEK